MYTRIVKIVLLIKKLEFSYIEVDPFTLSENDSFLDKHPFKKVPFLDANGFRLYETSAITRFLDSCSASPPLLSSCSKTNARIDQIISVIDNYVYWPVVRQVFANSVYAPLAGEDASNEQIVEGCRSSELALQAINELIQPSPYLLGEHVTLADIHLAPMIDYFQMSNEGTRILKNHSAILRWWQQIQCNEFMMETRPDLSLLAVSAQSNS